ncbi:hypothetical protein XENTR_v10023424 [Xenopus tropicalis]|uniref:Uncharacterized protein LOC105948534 n=1 Tax=Xenopus tropicalis TaxID=8364 RepID=A0A8J1IXR6_XENTR|nr:uncharacterized protein LOC105948534 [Xenopus tropicalis]KAE8578266.1 hypothetical protein XENTR_v10023424 [Xenopus tropicalis]
MASNRQLVGIFSRESQEAYDWLITFLLTISAVRDVRTVHISNTNYGNVMAEASKCAFAILYHTRNRGRINITDVTDSLYDRELEDLSRCLGRDKVIVVIDDLEDSSLAAKNLILQNQPSIGRWAVELFLFSDQEKTYHGTALCGNKMNELATLIKNADKKFRHGHPVYMGNVSNDNEPAEGTNCCQRLCEFTARLWICNSFKIITICIGFLSIYILILVIFLVLKCSNKAEPTSSPLNTSTDHWATVFSSISPTTLPFPENLTLSLENATTFQKTP